MNCCICKNEIEIEATTGWAKGHNPNPVSQNENDRCCSVCNDLIVIPTRLVNIFKANLN